MVGRAAAFLVFALAAACLAPPGGDPPPSIDPLWSEHALPWGEGHDHTDRAQHLGLSTPNFEILGYDPLSSLHYGTTAGGYFCGDAAEAADGRRIAAVESRTDVAFALADVTDPASPAWLGELVMPFTYVYDLAVVPDGRHVVLVTQRPQGLPVDVPLQGLPATTEGRATLPAWRTPCDPEPRPLRWAEPDAVPRPLSILLVDVGDPGDPVIVDQQPLAGYGHGVQSVVAGGRTLVLAATLGPAVAGTGGGLYEFYEVVTTPAGARLAPLSTWAVPETGAGTPALASHDGWIAEHPALGHTVAYLAGGDTFSILDLEEPRAPRLLGTWTEGDGREGYSGNLHSAYPVPGLRDGRHYVVLGPEFGTHPTDHPSGIVWVLDDTDPAHVVEVAAWTLPHDAEWNGTYLFSTHYFSVHGDTLFVSMYHGGLWAVDLAGLGAGGFRLLDSVGVFVPDRDPPAPAAQEFRWNPTLQEALAFGDGTLVTFDGNAGLYTLRFDEEHPAPPPEPWPVEPVTKR